MNTSRNEKEAYTLSSNKKIKKQKNKKNKSIYTNNLFISFIHVHRAPFSNFLITYFNYLFLPNFIGCLTIFVILIEVAYGKVGDQ